MSQRNSDVSALVEAELTCAAENVPFTPGRPGRAPSARCSTGSAASGASASWWPPRTGPVRFTELERHIEGISRRMLTLTLRNLERDGLLHRTVYPTVPPKVEYTATPMALELYESLVALTSWAERHRRAIAEARTRYDAQHAG